MLSNVRNMLKKKLEIWARNVGGSQKVVFMNSEPSWVSEGKRSTSDRSTSSLPTVGATCQQRLSNENRWRIVCGLFQVSARFKPDSEP